jgi:hypothetical protein
MSRANDEGQRKTANPQGARAVVLGWSGIREVLPESKPAAAYVISPRVVQLEDQVNRLMTVGRVP